MVTELKVKSWIELVDALHADSWNEALKRHRSRWVYRGLSNGAYRLEPSLMRIGDHYASMERLLINDFRQYARLDASPGASEWAWLSLAQHHGLPTRLLDWTYSPHVALHFATCDLGPSIPEHDGAVWCVNYAETNALLSDTLRHKLLTSRKSVFSIERLEEAVPTLEQFDAHDKDQFVVFFEPPSLDARIVNQAALFSVVSRPRTSHATRCLDEFLVSAVAGLYLEPEKVYKKIVIPASLKWEIRDRLDQANITERMLLPGLDGTSAWLRRHYTKRTWPLDTVANTAPTVPLG